MSAPSLSLPSAGAATSARMAAGLAALDDPGEWDAFSRRTGTEGEATGGCWESGVVFEGMHCAACALTLEEVLRAEPGVVSASVSAASHRGRVVWREGQTVPSRWMDAVRRAGYQAVPANDALATDRRRAETRRMLWRWLVAGLCMMQVMMYATPAYVSPPGDFTPDMVQLLRWASWVLSLPVLLFSCAPFFANAWRDIRQRRISMDLPVALGMAITFAVSSLGTFEPQGVFGREVYFDSFTMFVFFLLTGRWLELRLRDRTAGALEALLNRLPDTVQRERADGTLERVAVRRLAAGDIIQVLPGEGFPADGEVLAGATLADEALLTGESRPVPRGVGDAVVAGSHNLTAAVRVRVARTGPQTRYAEIVTLMEHAALDKPQLALLADRIARPFLLAVLAAAALACAWWWGRDPGQALMVAVAVLIVTCPCALSLATPAAMLASAGALARRGVLVRRLQALEALAGVDTVVFDKTGTLTRDAFVPGAIRTREGVTVDEALALAAALGRHSLHPVSRALVARARRAGLEAPDPLASTREVPGQGVQGVLTLPVGGSPVGSEVRLGSSAYCGIPPVATDQPAAHLADAQGWMASFELREDVRADARATVQALREAGVEVRLLSGDAPAAVARVAAELGIDQARGGCSPQDKLQALREAQQAGHRVAMVGDGLNDGPVLAGAHVSVAFGRAVPLAQARSDFVVLGEALGAVAQMLHQARRTQSVVRQNLGWAVLYNAVSVPLALAGWMPAWLAGLGMAASSLLVVVNALRLAAVPAEPVPTPGRNT
jgi:Cu2+-exporting ATPase